MKKTVFKLILNQKKVIEIIYEYIISQCEAIFSVKNGDYISFQIEPNYKNMSLAIGIFCDDFKAYFKSILEHESLEYTGMNYKRVVKDSSIISMKWEKGKAYLPYNEMRYIKLDNFDIMQLLMKIISSVVHIKEPFFRVLSNEKTKEFLLYISKKNILLEQKEIEIKYRVRDITLTMKKFFLAF